MSGRIAVVTGANRGIGLEVTRQLAAQGDTVLLRAVVGFITNDWATVRAHHRL